MALEDRYRALRAKKLRVRKPYTMRHTFISVGVTNGVNIKWLADYCGTSLAMIEKHYGKYIRNDADEQLSRLIVGQTGTLGGTVEGETGIDETQAAEKIREDVGGPTWTRTRTIRKNVPASKHERFLSFFAEEERAAGKSLIPKRPP
jgi:hypothetical protein